MPDSAAMSTRVMASGPCKLDGFRLDGSSCPDPWTISVWIEYPSADPYSVIRDYTVSAGDWFVLPVKIDLAEGESLLLEVSDERVEHLAPLR